ncbi:TetR/AcrR family transcriptional regulator [Ligilactobacillus equi]|uniref:TetR/AcrR family transcriptional regulator n=1 Tax=Ligilactobacillus equi TaxID=137357 RepID=UPI002ED05E52
MKDTHNDIINAALRVAYYKKDVKDITMNDIAKEAKLSRQAIYAKHFSNVDDIFLEIYKIIDEEVYKQFKKSLQLKSKDYSIFEIIADDLFPIIHEHRSWLKVMYTTSINGSWRDFLFKRYITLYQTYYPKNNGSNELNIALVPPITDYILSLIASWLSQDIPVSPTIFGEYFVRVMHTSPVTLVNADNSSR